jgi:uncharacterized protein (DUF736 family)
MENVKIGALWERTSPKGEVYFAGEIIVNGNPVKIVVFKNTKKDSEKHPDYRILLSNERKEGLVIEHD